MFLLNELALAFLPEEWDASRITIAWTFSYGASIWGQHWLYVHNQSSQLHAICRALL